jgi:glycosyltransferase involved in cell wall biosynthesis
MAHFCFYSHDLDRCHRCLRQTWDVALDAQAERRALARQLLTAAKGLMFPSQFLLDQHRELFSLPQLTGEIIEPGVPAMVHAGVPGRAIAYAGSVKRHKGAHLLPDLARLLPNADLHIFGGGDEDLLRAARRVPNIKVHGYYRSGTLPSLLARHRIGLIIVPSIVPESFGLVLSEAWLAGIPVVAFDLGAPAERIRREGGGWLAPIESGGVGLARIIEQWKAGRITSSIPRSVTSAIDAARAHVEVYRKWAPSDRC